MRSIWFTITSNYDLTFIYKTYKSNNILHKINFYARQKKGLMGSI